jgi:Protein of unknown function (DUF3592)
MIAFLIFKLVIFIGLFFFLGYFFVYKTILKLLKRSKVYKTGEHAAATIMDYKVTKDSSGAKRYYPIIQYITQKGEAITAQSRKERYKKYDVGKQLKVYYMADAPKNFYIEGILPIIKIAGIVLGFAGCLVLLVEVGRTINKLIA